MNIASLTVKNNPRSIKRVINYANLLKIIFRKNRIAKKYSRKETWSLQYAQITYAIASLQLTWPEIFQHFAQNPSPAILKRLEDMDYISTKIPEAKPLFERVRDPLETQSKISGFFDQMLMLIDQNGDGDIDTQEFKPIWEILTDTNLTNVKLESIEEQWKELETRIMNNLKNSKNKWDEEKVSLILNSLKGSGSNWKNPLYFRLLSAGNYFKNIIWDQIQIGTVATTRGEVIQLYLNEKTLNIAPKITEFIDQLSEDLKPYITEYSKSHYGTGSIKVDLLKISEIHNQSKIDKIMNEILKTVKQLLD